jgi:O-phosphoseryl-tRNA(Sec) kinase
MTQQLAALSVQVSLVLFTGLPGIGKTALASGFTSFLKNQKDTSAYLISYDYLIEQNAENLLVATNEWKSARTLIKNLVHALVRYFLETSQVQEHGFRSYTTIDLNTSTVQKTSASEISDSIVDKFVKLIEEEATKSASCYTTKYFIILDDNFYYESMRYEYFKLARDTDSCSYYCICLKTLDLDLLLTRNAKRIGSARLDQAVIERMLAKFEYPRDELEYEREFTFTETINPGMMSVSFEALWGLIVNAHTRFRIFVETKRANEAEKLERSKLGRESARNLVHECDLILRRLVSARLGATAEAASRKTILESKSRILAELKNVESGLFRELTAVGSDLRLIEGVLAVKLERIL